MTTELSDINCTVGDSIRRQRKEQNMTLEMLAYRAGLSVSHLGSIERGQQNTTLDTIAEIARALGIEPHHLFISEENKSQPEEGLPQIYQEFYKSLSVVDQQQVRTILESLMHWQ